MRHDTSRAAGRPSRSRSMRPTSKNPTAAETRDFFSSLLDKTMAETVAAEAPTESEIAANRWLPDHELRVHSTEFERTGFQGGLQWYRCAISPEFDAELALFSGQSIDVPSAFISGESDWGIY